MRPEEDPDVQLMLAVKRDDAAAFEALFRKYIAQVVGFALSFVGSRARAEELAQEAFAQVYRTRHRYQPRARFTTWLYRIVKNLCLSEVRRVEHRVAYVPRPGADDNDPPNESSPSAPRDQGQEEGLLAREGLDKMQTALLKLPDQQRAALMLARVEGLSYQEVAEVLECSVSAVKSLIHRATVTVRGELRDFR